MEAPKSSLAAKMAAIMGDVPTMIKAGNNTQQNYKYVTAEDVKAAVRPLFKKHRVALFSKILSVERTTSTNKNGTTIVNVVANMVFTLVDGDTGETMDCPWVGEANDTADKAVNKAATAGEKYWLTNTLMLSTSEPDADEEDIPTPARIEYISATRLDVLYGLGAAYYMTAWESTMGQFALFASDGRTERLNELTPDDGEFAIGHLTDELAKRKQPAAAQTDPQPA
jgi:ERF superfamily protein